MDITKIANEGKNVDSLTDREQKKMSLLYACFYYEIANMNKEIIEKDPAYREFQKLCIKNDIEDFTLYLYIYCKAYKAMLAEQVQEQERMNKTILPEEYYLKLLLPLYSKHKSEIEIKTNYKNDGVGRTTDSELLLKIKEYFTEKYIENNYNRIRLSQIKKNFQYNSNDANILDYSYLKNRLKEIEDKEKSAIKRGAPERDNEELELAFKIAYIIRFDKFIEQKDYSDITEYLDSIRLDNKEFRLINAILSSFDIRLQEKANSSSPTANYMRQRFKAYQKRKKDNITESYLNHLRLYYRNGTNFLLHSHSYIQYKELDYDTFLIH